MSEEKKPLPKAKKNLSPLGAGGPSFQGWIIAALILGIVGVMYFSNNKA